MSHPNDSTRSQTTDGRSIAHGRIRRVLNHYLDHTLTLPQLKAEVADWSTKTGQDRYLYTQVASLLAPLIKGYYRNRVPKASLDKMVKVLLGVNDSRGEIA